MRACRRSRRAPTPRSRRAARAGWGARALWRQPRRRRGGIWVRRWRPRREGPLRLRKCWLAGVSRRADHGAQTSGGSGGGKRRERILRRSVITIDGFVVSPPLRAPPPALALLNDLSTPPPCVPTRRSGKPREMVAPGPDEAQLKR